MHAKDTYLDPVNCPVNGVLDTKHFGQVGSRSWNFRTVGYGHDCDVWKSIVAALRTIGYDFVLSIEHEDIMVPIEEGLRKSVKFLRDIIFEDDVPGGLWWA